MTGPSDAMIWGVTLSLGALSFLIRFSFIGIIGDRRLPERLSRALGFVPVTVLPALVAPTFFTGPDGALAFEPGHLIPAIVTVAVGMRLGRLLPALAAGIASFGALTLAGL